MGAAWQGEAAHFKRQAFKGQHLPKAASRVPAEPFYGFQRLQQAEGADHGPQHAGDGAGILFLCGCFGP
jgi:hypothetical protein